MRERSTARVVGLGLLAVGLAGCLLGKARGEYWTGTSTASAGVGCGVVEFNLVLEDGRLDGDAYTRTESGTVLWAVRGTGGGGRISLELRTDDPRAPRPRLAWTGSHNPFRVELAESEGCVPARTATLQRR